MARKIMRRHEEKPYASHGKPPMVRPRGSTRSWWYEVFCLKEGHMTAVTHHAVHMPEAMAPAVHWLERLLGAVFFTVLAPLAFAIFIVSGLVLALGLANIL
jgi:hypothetical protein